MSLPWILDCN